MTNHDLDQAYTTLSQALTRVGEDRAALFLSMLSLSLISRSDDLGEVLRLIEQAEAGSAK